MSLFVCTRSTFSSSSLHSYIDRNRWNGHKGQQHEISYFLNKSCKVDLHLLYLNLPVGFQLLVEEFRPPLSVVGDEVEDAFLYNFEIMQSLFMKTSVVKEHLVIRQFLLIKLIITVELTVLEDLWWAEKFVFNPSWAMIVFTPLWVMIVFKVTRIHEQNSTFYPKQALFHEMVTV